MKPLGRGQLTASFASREHHGTNCLTRIDLSWYFRDLNRRLPNDYTIRFTSVILLGGWKGGYLIAGAVSTRKIFNNGSDFAGCSRTRSVRSGPRQGHSSEERLWFQRSSETGYFELCPFENDAPLAYMNSELQALGFLSR